jgi:hypothetical protein
LDALIQAGNTRAELAAFQWAMSTRMQLMINLKERLSVFIEERRMEGEDDDYGRH